MTGYLQVLGAVSIWAFFNGVLVKGIKTSGVGVGMWTGVFGAFFCLAGGINFGVINSIQLFGLIFLGVAAGLNNSFNYTAIKISIPVALLFHYLAPMLVIVWYFLVPVFYQPISSRSLFAAGIGIIGMIYMAKPHLREGNRKLVILGVASAIFYSLEIVLSGYVSGKLQIVANTSSLAKLLFQAMIMPIVGLGLKESVEVTNSKEKYKLILGGLLLCISFMLYFAGSATVTDLNRGVLGYIDRIGAIALGAYFFKEERSKITKEVWIGGAMIIGASLLIS